MQDLAFARSTYYPYPCPSVFMTGSTGQWSGKVGTAHTGDPTVAHQVKYLTIQVGCDYASTQRIETL